MKYSVYVFLDRQNRPYYVGKTNNMKRRRKEHLREIEKGNDLPKYNKARKLIRSGFKLSMRAIRIVYNEDEAYRLERYYIKKYRREGYQLFNCTGGGPYENKIKINAPKKPRRTGIVFPRPKKKKMITKKAVKKKLKGKKKRRHQ